MSELALGGMLAIELEPLLRQQLTHYTLRLYRSRQDMSMPGARLALFGGPGCDADLIFRPDGVVVFVYGDDGVVGTSVARFEYADPALVEQLERWCRRYDRGADHG